jgi:hypothetical protein
MKEGILRGSTPGKEGSKEGIRKEQFIRQAKHGSATTHTYELLLQQSGTAFTK